MTTSSESGPQNQVTEGRRSSVRRPEIGGTLEQYRLVRELGRGGQGTVYLAEDLSLGRKVALKVLDSSAASSPESAARFRREAMTTSSLQHPGICAVYEAKVDAPIPFIAMQYIEGETLARRISMTRERATTGASGGTETAPSVWLGLDDDAASEPEDSPHDDAVAVTRVESAPLERDAVLDVVLLFEKVARALAAAHDAGVVHRDIKPGNIMISKSGDPVLLDFGLARRDDAELESMTKAGDLFGTPAYMSPEQLSRQAIRIDARTDIWSLGVSLYECLALKRPFEAPTREGLYLAILSREPDMPRRINRALSADLEVVVLTALEKDRDRRYQTAHDLAEDLRRVRMKEPIVARPVGPIGKTMRWAAREPAKATLAMVIILTLPTIAGLVTAWVKDRPAVVAAKNAERRDRREALLADASWELLEGDASIAIDIYDTILADDPDCDEALTARILANLRLSRKDVAAELFRKDAARWRDPYTTTAIRAMLERNDTSANGAVLKIDAEPRSILDLWIATQQAFLVGERLERSGQEKSAAEEFRRAYDFATRASFMANTPRLDLAVLRAHAAGHLADPPLVIGATEPLEFHWPDAPAAIFWSAFARMHIDDPAIAAEAAAGFERFASMRPNDGIAAANLAVTLARSGRREKAEAAFKEAIRLRPADVNTRRNYAVFLAARDPKAAVVELTAARKFGPKDATLLATLGAKLIDLGHADQAIEALESAIEIAPDDPMALAALGRAWVDCGATDRGIELLRKSVLIDPNGTTARMDLAAALRQIGCVDDARAELEALLAVEPAVPEALCNLASLLETFGRFDLAIDLYRKGHAIGSQSPDWLHPSAEWIERCAKEAERLVKAGQALDRDLANDREPDDPEDQLLGARILAFRGRAEHASDWFDAAFTNDPQLGTDPRTYDRLFAAEAAATAAAMTYGKTAAKHRRRALAWLGADLAVFEGVIKSGRAPIAEVRPPMHRYRTSRALAGLRGAGLAALPADEKAAFTALWAAFDRLLDEK